MTAHLKQRGITRFSGHLGHAVEIQLFHHHGDQIVLMVIRDNEIDPKGLGNRFRVEGGMTATDDELGLGVMSMKAVDQVT